MRVSLRNRFQFQIECDDVHLLESMQNVMDGFKIKNRNIIVIPLRASVLLSKFNAYGIETDETCKNIIESLINNNKKRITNIQKIKEQYALKNIKFDYDYSGAYVPMEHQKIMFNAIYYSDASSIIADPGTCKTGPYLWAIDKRIKTEKIKRALVITLSDLKKNVIQEMCVQVPHLKGVALNSADQANKIINKLFKDKKKNIEYDIYIANYESMFSLSRFFADDFFQMIILDEAHRVGSPDSRQTKTIIDRFENSQFKHIITGTLHANNVMSFFMPFRFLGADTIPYANYYEFRRRHMYAVDPDQYVWVAGAGAVAEVQRITGNLSVMFKKDDCLNLPGLIREKYSCEMQGDQLKLYNQMSKDLVAVIDSMCDKCNMKGRCDNSCDGTIAAKSALVLAGKLHQIASGFYINTRYEIDGNGSEKNVSNTIILQENPKLDLLISTLNNLPDGDKVIIWTNYRMAIQLICDRLSKAFGANSFLTCYGDQDAFDQVNKWRSSPELYMVANPTKMGVGQNVQFSHYQIFFSNSRSWVVRDQAEGRQDRQGQTHKVTAIDLMCEDSMDEIAFKSLMTKHDLALTLSELSRVLKNKNAMDEILAKKQSIESVGL